MEKRNKLIEIQSISIFDIFVNALDMILWWYDDGYACRSITELLAMDIMLAMDKLININKQHPL